MDMTSEPDADDPRCWSIDQVVHEICHNSTPRWLSSTNPSLIPDRQRLEQTLKDNHIDGENLLALDNASLKGDLGIVSFGQRNAVLKAIHYLQNASPAYQESLRLEDTIARFRAGLPTPQITTSRISVTAPSLGESAFGLQPSVEQPHFTGYTFMNDQDVFRLRNSRTSAVAPPLGNGGFGLPPSVEQQTLVGSPSMSARDLGANIPRREGQEMVPRRYSRSSPVAKSGSLALQHEHIARTISTQSLNAESHRVDGFLDMLEADVNQSLNQEATEEACKATEDLETLGPPHTAAKAKRRIAPTLITDTQEQGNSYLGQSQLLPQEIFYGSMPNEDVSFQFHNQCRPSGLSRLVSNRVKYALRQPVIPLPNNNLFARFPYSARHCSGPLSLHYFTLFRPGEAPAAQSLNNWPALSSLGVTNLALQRSKSTIQASTLTSNPPDSNPFTTSVIISGENSDLGDFAYLLSKYPAVEGDQGLPTYGDSDEENEYDEKTWAEMEDEKAERQLVPTAMTSDQINKAIDEAIQNMTTEWHDIKFAKVQYKGYSKWKIAARARIRQPEIDNAFYWGNRSEACIARARKAILKDVWHKPLEVKAQCRSFEESLHQRLEYDYYLKVLQEDKAPPCPTRNAVTRKRPQRPELPDGEEIIESDTDCISEDNFVVDDSSQAGDALYGSLEMDFNPVLPTTRESITSRQSRMSSSSLPNEQSHNDFETPHRGEYVATADEADIESDATEDPIVSSAGKRRRPRPMKSSSIAVKRASIVIPSDPEESDSLPSTSPGDSDPDRSARLPKNKYTGRGRYITQPIDLSSDPPSGPEGDHSNYTSSTEFDVTTPDLNPPDIKTENLQTADSTLAKPRNGSLRPISKTSQKSRMVDKTRDFDLPRLDEIEGTLALDWMLIEGLSDHIRALAKFVYALQQDRAAELQTYVSKMLYDDQEGKTVLRSGLISMSTENVVIRGVSENNRQSANLLVLSFMTYVCCRNIDIPREIDKRNSLEAIESGSGIFFQKLHDLLERLANHLISFPKQIKRGTKRKSEGSNIQNELEDDTDFCMQDTDEQGDGATARDPPSHKKRKRAVAESQEALAQQQSDQQRVLEQDRRRALLMLKLNSMNTDNSGARYAINTVEPYVYLDPHIACRIKQHQVAGIQFMWGEIVDDPKAQGCLLAHTMGLGKTMQVISLLVTIAQCNQSQDTRIQQHIPKRLRENKILILCPPTLLDNWFDELLMWIPPTAGDILGTIRKISSRKEKQGITEWSRTGGILLLSYDLFRGLIMPSKKTVIDEEDQKRLEKCLLEQPQIIVADEAHKMKNPKSKISMVTQRFTSRSRIALTGSPLNNHLEEYYTMVNWIAPEYLGTVVQFKSKYSEPINAGLYSDSSAYDRRLCLRRLHILKRDLDPKVNRADISAIEKDMPSKTEYFITLPLTDLQKQAYDIYVNDMLTTHRLAGTTGNAQLWTWLAILSLLCNHPQCFMNKLEKERGKLISEDPNDEAATSGALTDDVSSPDGNTVTELPADVTLTHSDFDVMEKAMSIFAEASADHTLDDPSMSYRTLIVHRILEEAMKIDDKTLIFSHSIPTLDALETMLDAMGCKYFRIDGSTAMSRRQEATKQFNKKEANFQVFLISTRAGGLGLNLQGANRVIIFDFNFNPMWEEQAIGRAYRLGQKKPVFVYRFRSGGTFEEVVYNKAVFKTQLFQRVVDNKNFKSNAKKSVTDYLFPVRDVQTQDFEECMGKDPNVLDVVVRQNDCICNIELTETFQKEDDEKLTPEELKAADVEYEDQRLERDDPEAYRKRMQERQMQFVSASLNLTPEVAFGRAQRPSGMTNPIDNPRKSTAGVAPTTVSHDAVRRPANSTVPLSTPHMAWALAELRKAVSASFDSAPEAPTMTCAPNPAGIRGSFDDTYTGALDTTSRHARARSIDADHRITENEYDRMSTVNAMRPTSEMAMPDARSTERDDSDSGHCTQ